MLLTWAAKSKGPTRCEAIAAVGIDRFDIVLMDCRCRDGRFRGDARAARDGSGERFPRAPIIALTRKQQRAIASVASPREGRLPRKPFRQEQLRDCSRSGMNSPARPAVELKRSSRSVTAVDAKASTTFARAEPWARRRSSTGSFHCTGDAPQLLQAMRSAIGAVDAQSAAARGHQLKSGSAKLGAFELADLARAWRRRRARSASPMYSTG